MTADGVQALPTLLASRGRGRPGATDICSSGQDACAAAAAELGKKARPPLLHEDSAVAAEVRVRNTFIDTAEARSASLERFYREREVRTCPSNHIGRIRDSLYQVVVDSPEVEAFPAEEQYAFGESPCGLQWDRCFVRSPAAAVSKPQGWLASTSPGVVRQTPGTDNYQALPCQPSHYAPAQPCYATGSALLGTAQAARPLADASVRCRTAVSGAPVSSAEVVAARPRATAASMILGLVEECPRARPCATARMPSSASSKPVPAFAPAAAAPCAPPLGPAPGSAALPSLGSALHGSGGCRPCAFFHGVGCENGAICSFCHLCEAGERQRRRKERSEEKRAARSQGLGPSSE